MEDNPITHKVWREWIKKDQELSKLTKKDRLDYCSKYQWIYPKQTKRQVTLEALYSSVHHSRNRKEFERWFYVVCNYIFSRVHLGDCSYYKFKKDYQKQFKREKCTSDEFPQKVLLVLAMLSYITDFGSWYVYNAGSDKNRGYHYIIDKDKLLHWDLPYENENGTASTMTDSKMPEWVMSHTQAISFKEEGEDPDRLSWTLHPDWLAERQYDSISSVEVIEEGILKSSKWLFNFEEYQSYYNLSVTEQENIMKDWISYQKLRNLSCGILGSCKDDSEKPDGKGYAGRFHTIMTNMRSEHRHKYLRLDGELITEVDVSSAQPSFLGIMMYKETGVMSEWLRQALNGTFYEWIKENTGSTEDRATIKKWMMQYMYSCYQAKKGKDYDKPHHPTYENKQTKDPYLCFQQRLNKFLKENEPAIYYKIDYYKRYPEYREDKTIYTVYKDETGKKKKKAKDGKWCSKLSYDLVRMEVEYIKNCICALPEDEKFWTIHDCICVREGRSQEVKSIMENVSRQMYGDNIVLRLKRENTSKDYS